MSHLATGGQEVEEESIQWDRSVGARRSRGSLEFTGTSLSDNEDADMGGADAYTDASTDARSPEIAPKQGRSGPGTWEGDAGNGQATRPARMWALWLAARGVGASRMAAAPGR